MTSFRYIKEVHVRRETDVIPVNNDQPYHNPPADLCCPLSGRRKLYINPVIAADGETYEHDALMYLFENTTDPISLKTGLPFENLEVQPDSIMLKKVQAYRDLKDAIQIKMRVRNKETENISDPKNIESERSSKKSHDTKIMVPSDETDEDTSSDDEIFGIKSVENNQKYRRDDQIITLDNATVNHSTAIVDTHSEPKKIKPPLFEEKDSLKDAPAEMQIQFITLLNKIEINQYDLQIVLLLLKRYEFNKAPELIKKIMQDYINQKVRHFILIEVVQYLLDISILEYSDGQADHVFAVLANTILSVYYFYKHKDTFLSMRTIHAKRFTQQLSAITHVKVCDSPNTHVEASDSTNTHAVVSNSHNFTLSNLPTEVISYILSFLLPSAIRNFGSTSRRNWLIAQDNQTWKNLLQVNGCERILINVLRYNGFTNTDIFNCFPLLRNEQFNSDLYRGITIPFRPRDITITPMNNISSLKSWPIYLIPAEIISAISNRFTLIRLNKQSDPQKNQSFLAIGSYISDLSRVFAITDHRIITIFIQALDYLTCDDLLKIIRSFPGCTQRS